MAAAAAATAAAAAPAAASAAPAAAAPKIVKTTTKQTMVQSAAGVQHNKEEKVEDLNRGTVTVVSSTNKVEALFCSILSPIVNRRPR